MSQNRRNQAAASRDAEEGRRRLARAPSAGWASSSLIDHLKELAEKSWPSCPFDSSSYRRRRRPITHAAYEINETAMLFCGAERVRRNRQSAWHIFLSGSRQKHAKAKARREPWQLAARASRASAAEREARKAVAMATACMPSEGSAARGNHVSPNGGGRHG